MLLIFETLALRFPMSLSFVAGATAFGLISLPRFGAAAGAGCCAGGLAQGSVGSASSIMLDVEDVAREGFEGCLAGDVVVVPGRPNQLMASSVGFYPRWLVRGVTGWFGRRATR